MKDAWPVKAEANGGRQMRAKIDDHNFDNYSVEHTFADGTKFFYFGRTIPQAESKVGQEWMELVEAVEKNTPSNEAVRGA